MTIEPTLPLLEQPAEWLLSRLDSHTPRWIIGMAGTPGSGKSTLATQLAEEVNARTTPNTMIALGMDGFHLTKAELRQFPDPAEAFARRGAPWTFDANALQQRILGLRAAAGSAELTWPGFQHDVGDPIEAANTIPASTRLIIVEGLYLLHQADGWQAISQLFDERWYLDTPLATAMERLALRHMQAWGVTRAAAEHRIATNDRPNAMLVQQSAAFADWRVIQRPAPQL
jgi:pantothenate kinase